MTYRTHHSTRQQASALASAAVVTVAMLFGTQLMAMQAHTDTSLLARGTPAPAPASQVALGAEKCAAPRT
jgi:hypothetical protein